MPDEDHKVKYSATASFSSLILEATKAREEMRKLEAQSVKSNKALSDSDRQMTKSLKDRNNAVTDMTTKQAAHTRALKSDNDQLGRQLKQLASLRSEIEKISKAQTANIKVNVDSSALDTLKNRQRDSVTRVKILVNTGEVTNAMTKLGLLKAEIDALNKRKIKISVDSSAVTAARKKINDVQNAHARASRQTTKIKVDTSDVDQAQAKLSLFDRLLQRIGGNGGGAHSSARSFQIAANSITRFGASIGRLFGLLGGVVSIFSLVTASIGPLITLLGSLGGVALVAGNGLLALGSTVAALPGILGAAVTGVAALVIAIAPVANAFKLYGRAQEAVAKGSVNLAKEQQNAARQIQSAQRQITSAARGVETAERGIAEAQFDAKRAQDSLNRARKDAVRTLQDLQTEVARASLDEESARLSLVRAERELSAAQSDNMANALDRAEAEFQVIEAQQALEDIQRRNVRNQEDLTEAQAKGVEGSDAVVSAQHGVEQANQRVADSQYDLVQAQQALVDSQQALVDAQTDATESTSAATKAQDAYQRALEKLSPAARTFVETLIGMKDAWKELQNNVSEEFFTPLVGQLKNLSSLFPSFNTLLSESGRALGVVAARGIEMMSTPLWKKDFQTLATANATVIYNMGGALLSLIDGFKNLAVAAIPFTNWLTGALQEGANSFRDWTEEGRKTGSIAAALEQARDRIEKIVDITGNLVRTTASWLRSAEPITDWFLPALDRVSERWLVVARSQENATSPLSKWLNNIQPLLTATGELFGDLGRAVAKIASDPGNIKTMTDILSVLKNNVLPPLVALLMQLGQSGVLADVGRAFGNVLLAAKPIVTVILDMIEGFAELVQHVPTEVIIGLVGVLVLLKTALGIAAVVGGAARALEGLSKIAEITGRSVGGITAALGFIGFALTAAGLLMAAFASSNEKSAAAVEVNTAGVRELNDALKENAGAVDANIRKKAAQLLSEKDLLKSNQELAIASDVLIDALTGNEEAAKKVSDAYAKQIEYGKDGIKTQTLQGVTTTRYTTLTRDQIKALEEHKASFDALIGSQQKDAEASAAAGEAVSKLTDKQKAAAVQQKLFVETTQGLTTEQTSLAKSLADASSAFTTASEKANGLRTAYDLLFGSAISVNEANENFNKTLLQIAPAIKLNGKDLAVNTEAGLSNRDAIEAVAKSSVDMAIADVAAGKSLNDATVAHNGRIAALIKETEQGALNQTEVRTLVDLYGTIPTDVTTSFAEKNAGVIKDAFRDILKDVDYLLKNGFLPANQSVGRATGDLTYGYASGGHVRGPGTKTSDSIPAWLSDQEYVQQASAVDYYGVAFMDALNAKAVPRDAIGLQGGGRPSYNAQTRPVLRNKETDPLKQAFNEVTAQVTFDFAVVPLAVIRKMVADKMKERQKKKEEGGFAKGGLVGRRGGRRGYAGGGLVQQTTGAASGGGNTTSTPAADGTMPNILPSPDAASANAQAILDVMEKFKLDLATVQQATADLTLALWTANAAQLFQVNTDSTVSTVALWTQAHTDLGASWVAFSDLVIRTTTDMSSKIQDVFRNAIDASRSIWQGLKPAIGEPVNVVIGNILNAGLIAGFNKIASYVKLDGIGSLGLAQYAEGGKIRGPGGPKADVIPIMASAGEFMQPAASVDYYGQGFMEAIRQRKLPKFAEGGAIVAEGPGADSALSWMQGQTFSDYLSDAQARTNSIFNEIVANLDDSLGGSQFGSTIAKLPTTLVEGLATKIADAAKSLSPPTGHGAATGESTWQNMWGVISGQFPDALLTSSLRVGDSGYHGKGQAIDIASTQGEGGMHAIAEWIHTNFPDSTQMIHQPIPPTNILNGQPYDYGAATNADHYDHVHWAMAFKDIVAGLAASGMPEWPGGWGSFGQTSSAVDYNATAGVEQWRSVALAALAWTGQSQENITSLLRRMQQESGGNPNAINNWDINAINGVPSQGLMQVIPPTFAAYRDPRLSSNILDPMANIVASINYTLSRYGDLQSGWNRAGGYAEGGLIQLGKMHTGGHVRKTPKPMGPSSATGDPWHTGADAPWLGSGAWEDARYRGDTYLWSGNRLTGDPRKQLGTASNNLNHDELIKILQEGEFVMQASAVNQPGGADLMEALNSGNLSAASVMAAVMDMNATTGANNGMWPYGGASSAPAGNLPTGDIDWEDFFAPKPPTTPDTGHGGAHGGHGGHHGRRGDRHHRRRSHWGKFHNGGPVGLARGGRVGFKPSFSGLGDMSRAASAAAMVGGSPADMGWNGGTNAQTVNGGNSMTWGDVHIHNPVREKSSTSLRRQLEIYTRIYDQRPEQG